MEETLKGADRPNGMIAVDPDYKPLTRERYDYLYSVAKMLVATIDQMDVKQHEGCTLRRFTEDLFRMPKETPQVSTPATPAEQPTKE